MSNRIGILFTLGMTEQVFWHTHQHSGWTNPGHMQTYLQFMTLPCALPLTPDHKPSQSCGCDGWNVAQLVLLAQIRKITPGSLLFRGLGPLAPHSTLSIRYT